MHQLFFANNNILVNLKDTGKRQKKNPESEYDKVRNPEKRIKNIIIPPEPIMTNEEKF